MLVRIKFKLYNLETFVIFLVLYQITFFGKIGAMDIYVLVH